MATSQEPRLSLAQYASLRADCVTRPDELDELRKGYGLDDATDAQEAEAWGRKFTRDPGLFETYKALFQRYRAQAAAAPLAPAAPAAPGRASEPPPAAGSPGDPLLATAALKRILTLGQHATMAAELLVLPEDVVYAKYDLADPAIRAQVLRFCEGRLQDPTSRDTWNRLHGMAVKELRAAKK
jgi:hypothetical protein